MSEKERAIVGLVNDGVLTVDEHGHFWRVKAFTRTGRIKDIAPRRADRVRPDGYSQIRVTTSGHPFSALSHRVLWMLHHGPIPDGHEVNHKNGGHSDNWLQNLEVVTRGENIKHSYVHLGHSRPIGESNPQHKLTSAQACAIRNRCAGGTPKKQLAREYGVSPTAIRLVVSGRTWHNAFPQPSPVVPEGGRP